MSATTLLNFEYVINTLFRAWGSVSMLSHCLMPGFLLIALFSPWVYRLAFLSLRRMLKINHSVYRSHLHRKLTFRLSLPNLSPPCAEYDAHEDVGACKMGRCLPLFCTSPEWPGCCRRVHISLSPRESCLRINVFHVNSQANDKISARLGAITCCFPVTEFF